MKTCAICGKDFLVEDIYECEKCHKNVCPDCVTNQTFTPDDPKMVCVNCLEGGDGNV